MTKSTLHQTDAKLSLFCHGWRLSKATKVTASLAAGTACRPGIQEVCRAFMQLEWRDSRQTRSGLFRKPGKSTKGDLMMAIESHLATLEKKHGALEQEISEAIASPAMDDLHVASLKRKKLMLKEQIEKLRSQVTRH